MISVITCTIRDRLIRNVFRNFNRQTWKEKELIIVLNKDDMRIARWQKRAMKHKNISIYRLPEHLNAGECQNFAVSKAKYNIIAKMDDDDFYSPYYLEEQMKAIRSAGADIIGKRDCYYYLEATKTLMKTTNNMQSQFVDRVTDSSLMFRKHVIDTIPFATDEPVNYDSEWQKKCFNHGFKIYSTTPYNYTVFRSAKTHSHTWKISDHNVRKFTYEIARMDDYQSYVTKPI